MKRRVLLAAVAIAASAMSQAAQYEAQAPHTETCKATSEREVAALFDRWNRSLQTGDPRQVVANYAAQSILLPTVSDRPRLAAAERLDYFQHFLQDRPSGVIDLRRIYLGCNTAVDSGLYTFTFARTGAVVHARYTFTYGWDGTRWLITSHHSSAMPGKP
ncbi:MAG: SgcJ/EcaC family oxidoreductase [Telluria sp.]